MAVRSNLRVLHSLKEAKEARRIPYREVSEYTGIAGSTLSALMNNKVTLFYADTLDRLCSFYQCEPGDIIVRVREKQERVAA
jgi:putative transcriptional regulator